MADIRDVRCPFHGTSAVSVNGFVDTYNPRLGDWARDEAICAAREGAARLAARRAAQEENWDAPAWGAYEVARRLAGDLRNPAAMAAEEAIPLAIVARELEEALWRLLPNPSVTTPDAAHRPARK